MNYDPKNSEMCSVLEAIGFERKFTNPTEYDDTRYMVGYIDAVCTTMAEQDPYLEDVGDYRMMREILANQRGTLTVYSDRKHAYLSYIRLAALALELQ